MLRASPLPFEEHDTSGHRYIERRNGTRHRNPQQDIAMLLDKLMQTLAFTSQDDYRRCGEVRLAVNLIAAFIQPVYPEALLFQTFYCLADVTYAHHRQVLECARGGF